MATGRMISTSVATDHQVAMLSIDAEALYLRAIPHLDRDGLITGDPVRLLALIAPLRFSVLVGHIAALVDEWVTVKLVIRYQSPDGPVLWFKGFSKNQVLRYERERPSPFPPPPGHIRTDAGLQRVTALLWHTDTAPTPDESGLIPTTPDSSGLIPTTPDSGPQAEEQAESEAEAEIKAAAGSLMQPDSPPPPAPTAAADPPPSEAARLLADFGVSEPSLSRLAGCPPDHVRGWMHEAIRAGHRIRDPVAFVIARLKARQRPPRAITAAEWLDLYPPPDTAPDLPDPPAAPDEPAAPPIIALPVDPEAASLWRTCVGELQLQVTPDIFEMYLFPLRPCALENGILRLHAPNPLAADWVSIRLRRPIERNLAAIHGQPVAIEVITAP